MHGMAGKRCGVYKVSFLLYARGTVSSLTFTSQGGRSMDKPGTLLLTVLLRHGDSGRYIAHCDYFGCETSVHSQNPEEDIKKLFIQELKARRHARKKLLTPHQEYVSEVEEVLKAKKHREIVRRVMDISHIPELEEISHIQFVLQIIYCD